MALLKEIFGVCSVLFILLEARATVGYSRSTCPAVKVPTVNNDCKRIYNRCSSDEACSNGLKCCPSSRDYGCSLRCIKPRELEGCPEPLDFAFVVDTSGSISRRNFVRQREFIEQMIDGFDISEEGTHVAIVEYSSTASVVLKFNSFTGVQLNAVNLKRQARKLPHQRGYTYIDKGLHLTNTEVFSVKGGMRPNVTKIVLVMTDGRQTVGEGFLSSDILHDAVQPLKDKGIRVISLGIGTGTLLFDLLTLASTDEDVYSAADFKELKNLVTELTERNCPVHGKWSDWRGWGDCTVPCGGGQQTRYRDCDNPRPAYGGRQCPGASDETRPCNELPCAVDGGWTEWKPWEICPVTCGGGIQNQYRTCTDPPPSHGGKNCSGEGILTRPCNEEPCPVDGKWADWGDWELCSVTCAGGKQNRFRTCTNPPPRFGGRDCSGVGQDVRSCNEDPCPIDGRWTRWGTWEPCPVSCGGGIQLSKRSCTNPAPAFGGDDCEGESVRLRSCNERGCPADGNWSEWSEFTPCTLSCAGGIQNRSRTCTNPPPKNDGKYCAGESSEVRLCNTLPCPVDGGWSLFGEWGSCSLTCGSGVQDRQRTCTNPSPAFGGRPCDGSSMETRFCQQFPCPVNGRWTGWDSWSPCTVSCGGGQQERSRSCTNPPPAHGGADCEGPSKEVQSCNENHCPVDGKWTVWRNWGICSLTCGGGVQDRSRTCTNPPPAFGGAQCVGPSRSTRLCNDNPCPGDGKWSAWKPWSPCSVSCSLGTQSRSRTCTNPPPIFGGKDCVGKSDETKSCNKGPCPVNGRWARWNPWGLCPVRCGGGTQVRSRSCTNPPPAFGGANCIGDRRQVQSCNEQPCEVHGNWARWQSWSKCSKSCGGGDQSRMRTCTNPSPLHGGRQCSGRNKETRFCNRRPCPVDGNWADWKPWSRCSRSCGGGTQVRLRTCTNPPRSNGGSWCIGSQQERQSCNEEKLCPVDGGWSFWSYWGRCSVSCGSGVMYRTRTCTSPPPAHGGVRCRGESREIYYCERSSCPVDGNWAQWGRFSRCSRRCSGGVKRRYRSCSNPRPSNGGKQCPGEAVEEIPCNTRPCSVNGNWGRWDSWSPCSKTCGGLGRRIRRRQCNNPPPSNGGRYCVGDSTLTASCAAWLPCEVSCNIPLDFAIIADTSGSISRKNFQLLQNFIRGLVDSFQVDEDYTHIAIIEYSTTASVQLHFNDLSGKNLTRQNVKEKVQSMPHKRGYTYIDRALRMADRDVFTYAAGMRYNVDKVALVMTDGVQTVEKNSGKSDIEILTEASKPLKEKGVRIISLGIGKRVNRKSLEAISSGRDVYSSRTFSELKTLVKKLKKGTCHATAAGYKYVRRTR